MSLHIGLMQGRLSPPKRHPIQEFPEQWEDEFPLAARLGFDAIEYIFGGEEELPQHPLLEDGCASIRRVVADSGVTVLSICADYFLRHPLHRGSTKEIECRVGWLRRLIPQGGLLGIRNIVIPCVDEGSLRSLDEQGRLVEVLASVVGVCQTHHVRLTLELDLPPQPTRRLIEQFHSPWVGINYDIGNSAALGYDPVEEWAAYGAFVSSVHIKDRRLRGDTVPLGTGDARFDRFFASARAANYQGLLTIQGARGTDHAATALAYKQFVESLIKVYGGERSAPNASSSWASRGSAWKKR